MKLSGVIGALMLGAASVAASGAAHAQNAEVYPVEYWAAQETISNITLSPDGTRLAAMVRPGLEANPIIMVYDTSDLSKEPKRFSADPLEIIGAQWLSNDTMVVSFRGQVRERIRGFNQGTFKYTAATLDVDSGRYGRQFEGAVRSTLPALKNKVLVALRNEDGGAGASASRPPSFYIADTKRGSRKLVLKGNLDVLGQDFRYTGIGFDDRGNPRTAMSVKTGSGPAVFQTLYRKPGDNSWTTIYEQSEDSFEEFRIVGYTDDPTKIYVTAHNGDDKIGLWIFDTEAKAFDELVYRRKDADVAGVLEHPDRINHPDEVIAVSYGKEKYQREFFDPEMAELFAVLEASLPNAHQVRIFDQSRDGSASIVQNIGPKDSGTFYLLRDGGLQKIGSVNPFVSGENLAEMEYITYEARDGRTIPAYVTMPTQGEAPYPTIVLPHGGPFIPEVVTYDKWSQMLANNGYLVIQPQYRGSEGYGLDHFTSAFLPSGQGGYAMQDDKDDGALHLVREGLADPDRLAMFGWSYGGYAAVVAAHRQDQIYQCAIAGASVPDTQQQVNYYRNSLRGSGGVAQRRMWDDSYNPIEHPEDLNIPLFLIHGSADQRTPLRGAKDYMAALDRAGKEYKFLELPGADHFFGSIGYENELNAYTAMLNYLKNDCGEGGL